MLFWFQVSVWWFKETKILHHDKIQVHVIRQVQDIPCLMEWAVIFWDFHWAWGSFCGGYWPKESLSSCSLHMVRRLDLWPRTPWHLRRAALHVIVTMLNDEQTSIPRNTFMIFGETLVRSDHWKVFVVFWKVLGFLIQGVYWSVSDSMRGMGMWLKVPVTPLASANWCKKFSDPVFVHQSGAHEKKF